MIHISEIVADANAILAKKNPEAILSEADEALAESICRRLNNELSSINPSSVTVQKRPTRAEAIQQANEAGLPSDEGNRFFDYYESNGWRIGKNPMKNWRSAMANWKRSYQERNPQRGQSYAV